ncbi:30S ribosomal protein S1 [Coxiella burnetii]|uniref:30S ribosomal protein S1 n=1 Tax=Coxiella burnetii TaxID=777 RepID=UPI0000ED016B|nr:30S ribosomal protein S1 [Coxiella burnetii]AIT63562.1 30S ribosomal protein S1 [Coxiella burnetii str. Namibia]ATN86123.1 30S ribosomal protein S1 [Coxiella burnetii str. Schperling]EAX32965.1 30S ribosomal protein S1 [Coxiella burnetii 'MSU Goat Q177']EDR35053.1 ribosomal protein S1 [Coxiella burnetii Q321]PHH57104.1 30S ribosomal protein S1 [Coxiella burnetii]
MSETFAELFEKSLTETDLRPGALVKATVVEVRPDRVIVNAGLKSEGIIPASEFRNEEPQIGDEFFVVIEASDNGFGETRLSREKARRAKAWSELEKAYKAGEMVKGVIIERVKGGFTVDLNSVRAFLPGSLVDVKPVRDPGYLEDKEIDFKIIKMDQRRNNVVVSRRAVMEAETSAERQARLEELQEGQEIKGVIKNITDYGAFVDLGGVDGLLHITDMAWGRVKHPSDLLNVGDEVHVKVLKFDRDKKRVSLGMKQLADDPWAKIERRYPVNSRVFGKVTNITDYGCFVKLEEGVEGLVHTSELDWTNKNIHPSKVVQSGEEVEVMVLEIDEERRRISLGIKQCKRNPWQEFAEKHEKDEKITGKVRSITDFGMFIGLEGDIDGLVHLSDISWTESGEEAIRNYKKGDEVQAVILGIDPERERISLGIKQLEGDPFMEFVESYDKDAVIQAKVKEVESKQAVLELADQVLGQMRLADYTYDRVKDLTQELNVGDEVAVKIVNVDRKNRLINVSHKAVEGRSEKGTRTVSDVPTKTTLGDLLKEKIQSKDE